MALNFIAMKVGKSLPIPKHMKFKFFTFTGFNVSNLYSIPPTLSLPSETNKTVMFSF